MLNPKDGKYSHSVVSPSGYISKMGVDGTMSDTGPYIIERSRKSYVAGACMKVKSNLSIIEAVYAFSPPRGRSHVLSPCVRLKSTEMQVLAKGGEAISPQMF